MRTSGLRPSLIFALLASATFLGVVSWQSWAGITVTPDGLLVATIAGLSVGSLYAISATGLVVVAAAGLGWSLFAQIGRASCRERV